MQILKINKLKIFKVKILDALIEQTKLVGPSNQKLESTLIELTSRSFQPYFEMLKEWIYRGVVNDKYKEFLIDDTKPDFDKNLTSDSEIDIEFFT